MTESFAAIPPKQAALSASSDWSDVTYKVSSACAGSNSQEPEIDLKEAFDWLIGNGPGSGSIEEIEDSDDSVKQRRLDLLMWLMNLELRLSPYGEPA